MKYVSLKTILLITFIGFSTIIIGITIILSNTLLKNEFLHFADQTHTHELVEIKNEIINSFEKSTTLSKDTTNYLNEKINIGIITKIKKNSKIIYDGFAENKKEIQTIRKSNIAQEKDTLNYFDDIFYVNEKIINVGAHKINITTYSYRPLFLNQQGIDHLNSLSTIFIYVFIFSIIVSIFLGFILTRLLATPLKKIVNNFQKIDKGQYDQIIKNNSLVIEYNQLINSFNNLSESLLKQEMVRKNLSTDLSHEFRTPLTAIKITLENIEEGVWSFNEVQNSLLDEVTRMELLINDINKFEKTTIDAYNLKYEEVNIEIMIHKILTLLHPQILNKKIKINLNIECIYIYADKQRIHQVLFNIISNSIKYNNINGEIKIETSKKKNVSIISIKDNGIGISDIDKKHIFKRFYRANNVNLDTQSGMGVGLNIVSEIMKAHKGKVLLFSQLNKGTEFLLIFPN